MDDRTQEFLRIQRAFIERENAKARGKDERRYEQSQNRPSNEELAAVLQTKRGKACGVSVETATKLRKTMPVLSVDDILNEYGGTRGASKMIEDRESLREKYAEHCVGAALVSSSHDVSLVQQFARLMSGDGP
jgi:hypothetical protein